MANKSFANDFTGNWIWPNSMFLNSIQIKFNENGYNNNLSGQNQSLCGPANITGASNKDALSLTLTFSEGNSNCPAWLQLIATCQNAECTTIQGTWYDSNHLMGNLVWFKEDKNFYISSPKPDSTFYIDANSNMPSFTFMVNNNYPIAALKWSLNIDYRWKSGNVSAQLPDDSTTANNYTPDLSPWKVIGGTLAATVTYDPAIKANTTATANYQVYGTNPGKGLIIQEIKDSIQAKIACIESGYRQFEAPRENGQGLPLIGRNKEGAKIGGIGIMQILDEKYTAARLWNWRQNIHEGLDKLNEKRSEAKRLHINERIRLNSERTKLGLPNCPVGVPTPLNPEQEMRESIRRYNYGVEYRWEPRNAKDCAGQWIISPSCIRNHFPGCEPDYVNKVLQCVI